MVRRALLPLREKVAGGAGRMRGFAMRESTPRDVMLDLAKRQRRALVNAEASVWRALRDRRCANFKFRRQVPIGNYIADFICFEKRLLIEIDGPSHEHEDQIRRDACRDDWFRREGFRVLRLSNDLVIGSPDLAIQRIEAALNA
jgi:very-short-patch-repair endonuclease